jgi:exopolysaccharide biosynthesis protein
MKRMILPLIFFAAFIGLVSHTAFAAEKICSSRLDTARIIRWKKISPGLEVRDFSIQFEDGSYSRMTGVRINPDLFHIRLLWKEKKNSFLLSAGEIARQTNASVVVNAGYFDKKWRPLGYFQSGNKIYNSRLLFRGRRRALHLGAVFYVRNKTDEIGIATREAFNAAGVREAFQAGPYLVRRGKPDLGLEAYREFRRPDRRTILALGKKGRLLLLVSEEIGRGISWCELQYFLSLPEPEGGLGVLDAMNLDGGSSSQLYARGKTSSRHVKGRTVPALIVVIPREEKDGR